MPSALMPTAAPTTTAMEPHAAGDDEEVQEVRGVAGHAEGEVIVGSVAALLLGSVGALRVGRHRRPASGRRDAEGRAQRMGEVGPGVGEDALAGGGTRRREHADARDTRARIAPGAATTAAGISGGIRASPRTLRPEK